jgi:hypothetical protein
VSATGATCRRGKRKALKGMGVAASPRPVDGSSTYFLVVNVEVEI